MLDNDAIAVREEELEKKPLQQLNWTLLGGSPEATNHLKQNSQLFLKIRI
jgi:hypothetical protein